MKFTTKTLTLAAATDLADQATGYNTLANGGFVGTRHAITQLVTRSGQVFYDFDRDGPCRAHLSTTIPRNTCDSRTDSSHLSIDRRAHPSREIPFDPSDRETPAKADCALCGSR